MVSDVVRGSGLGSQLLEQALIFAKGKGCQRITFTRSMVLIFLLCWFFVNRWAFKSVATNPASDSFIFNKIHTKTSVSDCFKPLTDVSIFAN